MATHEWAEFVVTARKLAKMTQEEFARHTNIPIGTLRNWEQGKSSPNMSTILLVRYVLKAADVAAKKFINKL